MKKFLMFLLSAALLASAGCATSSPEPQADAAKAGSTCERSTGSNICRK